MNPAALGLLSVLGIFTGEAPAWYLEQPLTGLGGDIDAMFADPHGGIWTAVTGETTAEGRARVYYRSAAADTWELRYEGPTATDLSLHAAGPGELYFGFNQPLRAFEPTLLRLGPDGIHRLPAPAERLDDLEFLQVGDYALTRDDEGWACGQHGALWRLQGGAWSRAPSPFAWAPGDPQGQHYCVSIDLLAEDDGLMLTSEGRGARWDGRAWREIAGPDGREALFLRNGRGLALSDDAFLRYTAGGWVQLASQCDAATADALVRRGLVVDHRGALGLTRDLVIDLGAASWTCRPSGLDVGLRAAATAGGALWVLSDDGIHREASAKIVTFVDAPGDALPRGLQYPLVVDLDLDGDLDVIAALGDADVLPSTHAAHGTPALWQNLGGGAFQRSAELPSALLRILPRQIAAGDLDGDADLDLVTLDIHDRLQTWGRHGDRYRETGTWLELGRHELFLADFEGDGDLDVLVAGHLLQNDGVGVFTDRVLPPALARPTGPWFDADGDADADVVGLHWRDPATFFRNEGGGDFSEHPLAAIAEAGTVADLDLDGAPEFLAQRLHYYHLALPFRRCDLTGAPRCDDADEMTTPAGVLADLDADGRLDIIVGSLRVDEQPPRSGEVHLGRADGGFRDVTHASGLRPRATPFDADGDGDRDVYTVTGGLALQRGAPDTWLRVHPRQAASDRLASGAWITVRDADDQIVASGIADAGLAALGLPDPDARYAVTVRFPGGASRTIADVPARVDLVVHDLDGLAGGLARVRLWATGTWRLLVPARDLLAPLLALALTLALARLRPRLRPWLPTFAGLALAGLPLWLGFTVRGPVALAWLLSPLDLAAAALLTAPIAAIISARRRVRVGPFRLRERLGAGAAGTVWRAERNGEDLALKLYDVDVMESADARERFFREARIGAEIQHPNLVQIVDAGRLDDGRCFLVMKRIDGPSLAARIADGPRLPRAAVLQIGIDVAGALAALHAAGVVHRDVKPANIVLRRDGRAVLTDLGLARSALFRTVTRLDVAVGTLAYMSPEQAIGRPLDGRADLWSLGVVLYELLSDRRPFAGQHEMELIYLLCNVDPPDLRAHDPTIPADLAAIVMRCLAREPDERHADAAALGAALAEVARRERSQGG